MDELIYDEASGIEKEMSDSFKIILSKKSTRKRMLFNLGTDFLHHIY